MCHSRTAICSGDKQQMNGSFQSCTAWKINVGAILEESGIQSRESITRRIRVAAQMRFQSTRILCDFVGEAIHFDSLRQRAQIRQLGYKPTIHKHEAASRAGHPKLL